MSRQNEKPAETGITFDESECRTKQALTSTNINDIVRRHLDNSDLVPIATRMPIYGDFSEVGDFQQALDQVANCRSDFMALPAEVRDMVGHTEQGFIDWVQDPANHDEGVRLGLFTPEAMPAEPVVVKILQPPEEPEG